MRGPLGNYERADFRACRATNVIRPGATGAVDSVEADRSSIAKKDLLRVGADPVPDRRRADLPSKREGRFSAIQNYRL